MKYPMQNIHIMMFQGWSRFLSQFYFCNYIHQHLNLHIRNLIMILITI